jgi:hypothetical protein
MIEHSYELDLKKTGRTGTIFALKNFEWKDKQEIEQKTELTVDFEKASDQELNQLINL